MEAFSCVCGVLRLACPVAGGRDATAGILQVRGLMLPSMACVADPGFELLTFESVLSINPHILSWDNPRAMSCVSHWKKLLIRRIKVSFKPLIKERTTWIVNIFSLVTSVSFWHQDRIQEEQIEVTDMLLPNLRALGFGLGDHA